MASCLTLPPTIMSYSSAGLAQRPTQSWYRVPSVTCGPACAVRKLAYESSSQPNPCQPSAVPTV
ncbi:hypothetical protein ADL28_31325 [Streptomyces violaceusniger]|uniref:Uncharacterized protein n=1 Tax=Streptomyces violaceusniger TaxID=68280 RepID=A0A0X3VTL3_STRVO|nr:hypothetical protein ADL28_31325 [Streptomyces violaceusniger]